MIACYTGIGCLGADDPWHQPEGTRECFLYHLPEHTPELALSYYRAALAVRGWTAEEADVSVVNTPILASAGLDDRAGMDSAQLTVVIAERREAAAIYPFARGTYADLCSSTWDALRQQLQT